MMLLTRLPVEVTVHPPLSKRVRAFSARPVIEVLLSTIKGNLTTVVAVVEAAGLDGGVVEATLADVDAGVEGVRDGEVFGVVAGVVLGAAAVEELAAGAAVARCPLGCCRAMIATTRTTIPRTASSTPMICSFRRRTGDSGKEGVMQAD
jgi:hypothetical protein